MFFIIKKNGNYLSSWTSHFTDEETDPQRGEVIWPTDSRAEPRVVCFLLPTFAFPLLNLYQPIIPGWSWRTNPMCWPHHMPLFLGGQWSQTCWGWGPAAPESGRHLWNGGTLRLQAQHALQCPPTSLTILLPLLRTMAQKKLISIYSLLSIMSQAPRCKETQLPPFPLTLLLCGLTMQTPLCFVLSFRNTYNTTRIWWWLKLESGHWKKYKGKASSSLPLFVIKTTVRATLSQKLSCAQAQCLEFYPLSTWIPTTGLWGIILPFYRQGNQGSEHQNNSPGDTQLLSDRNRI